jgi:toxin-antitoxin system PIN domain toxin
VDLCDSNVWLALALSRHIHHGAARNWLEAVEQPASILLCRATQQGFLRLLTNASVLAAYGNPPLTNREAWEACESLLGDYRVVFQPDEPRDLVSAWREFALRETASPKLWMDSYLAAFAKAGGHRMVTTDKAYRQFAELQVVLLGA